MGLARIVGTTQGAAKQSLSEGVAGQLRARRALLAAVAMIITIGVVVGVVTGGLTGLAHQGLYASGLWSRNGPSTLPAQARTDSPNPTPTPTPTASASTSASAKNSTKGPRPVLAAATSGPVPDREALAARIAAVRAQGAQGNYSGAVVDVGSGKTVFRHQARQPRIPASTMKLLTVATALSTFGPQHTFTTSVVQPKKNRIILIGGGDPYLATSSRAGAYPRRASITDLARATAERLRRDKISRVSLGYDASLFTGPAWNPAWPSFYVDQVTPVSALWVDEGRAGGGSPGPRVRDPAGQAAAVFAAALRKQGVRVTGVRPAKAPRTAAKLASVSSMPLERIVERLLMVSDNDAAEVLFRQVAVGAKRKGSSAEAAKAVRAVLKKLGVWVDGTTIVDGSGLSRETEVPAATMAHLLRHAAQSRHPELRAVITGLPVAGVEGSLRNRYSGAKSLAGRGFVRGKTGTLRNVRSLAGLVRTRDGSVLVYAFLVNDPTTDFAAKVWLDGVSVAIATCGCR